jgi:hypothetical protein
MWKKTVKWLLILAIAAGALGLRLYSSVNTPFDNDEFTFMNNALAYAGFMRQGRWTMLAWYDQTYQHPPLFKIVYATALLTQPPLSQIEKSQFQAKTFVGDSAQKDWWLTARSVASVVGTLAVLALALINPLAGAFAAVQSLSVHFTSIVYLEALPFLASLLSAAFYLLWLKKIRSEKVPVKDHILLALSAAALGATAASKYQYCVVGVAIVIHFAIQAFRERKLARYATWMAAWAGFAMLSFFFLDPYLWRHTAQRLEQSVFFHVGYSESSGVTKYDYPWWQQIVWLTNSISVFFPWMKPGLPFSIDPLISVLALIGLPRLWKRNNLYLIWLVMGLVVLFIWPTKWPQYVMIVMAPLCFSAAEGTAWLLSYPLAWLRQRHVIAMN